MARFPDREAEIKALAQNIVTGLAASAADFPAPPVASADLQALLDSFVTLCDDAVAARAASEQATETKAAGLDELVTAMRADLRYAEDAVNYDDAKLTALGWGAKAAPTALEVPGQPRSLEAPRQGEDGSSWTGKSRPTAARWRPTRSSAANAPQARGRL